MPTHTHLTAFPGGEFCTNCGHVTPLAGPGDQYHWWTHASGEVNRDTLAFVATWMAEQEYTARDLAYMVDKPWKFTDEFIAAVQDCRPVPPQTEPQMPAPPNHLRSVPEPEEQTVDLLKALQESVDRHRAAAARRT